MNSASSLPAMMAALAVSFQQVVQPVLARRLRFYDTKGSTASVTASEPRPINLPEKPRERA
jgi:hypothetical protein